jgi:hypothetical protein
MTRPAKNVLALYIAKFLYADHDKSPERRSNDGVDQDIRGA